ncbi:MAG: hypothetical protein BBJ57_11190 [Desulfobacterales bacterium PC51MH44]|nr:MAG: hypothetical protein BBJ57_11190 [Desulfobacterales bacterium PC51MH44]
MFKTDRLSALFHLSILLSGFFFFPNGFALENLSPSLIVKQMAKRDDGSVRIIFDIVRAYERR